MTPEAQRLAIAKVCGWEGCADAKCDYRKAQHLHKGDVIAFPESYSIPRYPDYPKDLNAMREALQWLFMQGISRYGRALDRYETQEVYMRNLLLVCKCPNPELEATAAQQAEAFLRTLGLWEEVPG